LRGEIEARVLGLHYDVKTDTQYSPPMAADDETQDAVRRILKERPPEDLPSGSEARLRRRLDEEKPPPSGARPSRAAAARKKKPKARAR
jgi:hypothetical protein